MVVRNVTRQHPAAHLPASTHIQVEITLIPTMHANPASAERLTSCLIIHQKTLMFLIFGIGSTTTAHGILCPYVARSYRWRS